ncbi:Cytochrome P450 84A1 [Acorus gramineus]|uniref:Cytochrome P450 84A1 n=1 Tax=Acorus gramineus TaxID=55184 RepID=A0AAV9B981_ACOGR|nr:Cytochrome P450 84A1 [Acorus gramineus]
MSSPPLSMQSFLLFFAVPFIFLFGHLLRRRRPKLPFPPGPKGLPLLGNMNIMDQMTHRGLAKLAREFGGLVHLRLGMRHAFVVSTPDVAREVLQVQDNLFSNRPATIAIQYLTYDRADMAFAHYGPFWRQMRKLCVMKLFSRKRAESWAAVREEVELLLSTAHASRGTPVDLGEAVFNLTMNITYRAAFGVRSEHGQQEFISILQEFSKLFGAFNLADFVPWLRWFDPQGINKRLVEARGSLDQFIDHIIDEHVANPKPEDSPDTDMVDDMLTYLDTGDKNTNNPSALVNDELPPSSFKLTRNNIKAIIMDVMFGGTETVASAIEWAMAELMKSPADLKRVQEELAEVVGMDRKVHESDLDKLPFLMCAMKETLRLHPPIPLLLHETAEDCEVSGYHVPARSRVMINSYAIGRDPKAWEEADAFKPARFERAGAPDFKGSHFELIPFGSGRRSCPGMQLGLYALYLTVAQLLHCFEWELPNGMKPSELDMNDVFGLTAPRAVRLVAVPTPRLSCPLF